MCAKRGGENAEELDSREAGMTIEVVLTKRVTCNRCSHEDVWVPETPEYLKFEWGKITQGKVDFDLCPSCTREVKAWIRNGR